MARGSGTVFALMAERQNKPHGRAPPVSLMVDMIVPLGGTHDPLVMKLMLDTET